MAASPAIDPRGEALGPLFKRAGIADALHDRYEERLLDLGVGDAGDLLELVAAKGIASLGMEELQAEKLRQTLLGRRGWEDAAAVLACFGEAFSCEADPPLCEAFSCEAATTFKFALDLALEQQRFEDGEAVLLAWVNEWGVDAALTSIGFTALMYFAQHGVWGDRMVETLLQHGAEINRQTSDGHTSALMAAVRGEHAQVVDTLLRHGAEVSQVSADGNTPMLAAVHNGHAQILDALLQHGAEVNQADTLGRTALNIAAVHLLVPAKTAEGVVEVLLQHRADVNHMRGSTALIAAAMNDRPDMVRFLLRNGADMGIRDGMGFTALSRATSNKHVRCVEAIRQHLKELSARAMLDEGCIELMHSGQTAGQAGIKPYRVQILEIKPTQADRYRVIISDGRHYMQARHLAPPPPASPEPATAPQRCRRRKPRTRCTQLTVPRFALAQAMLSATLSPMLQGVGVSPERAPGASHQHMITVPPPPLSPPADPRAEHRSHRQPRHEHRAELQGAPLQARAATAPRSPPGLSSLQVILILQFALISNDQPQIGLPQQSFPAPPSDAEVRAVDVEAAVAPPAPSADTSELPTSPLPPVRPPSAALPSAPPPLPNCQRAPDEVVAAVRGGELAVLKAWLDGGGQATATFDNNGNEVTLLTCACSYAKTVGHEQLVELLIQRGAIRRHGAPSTLIQRSAALVAAVTMGCNQRLAAMLLQGGADVESSSHGTTVLMDAASQGNLPVVELLLRHGARVNPTYRVGDSPLVLAAGGGHMSVVDTLLRHRAEVNYMRVTEGECSFTALMNAAYHGHPMVMDRLLLEGADPHLTDAKGRKALDKAKALGNTECVEVLMEHSRRHCGALLAEEEAEKAAQESKKARKKKKKAGSSGEAGPSSQECELQAPAEEASTAEAAAAAATAAVEVELAVALEESTRLTDEAARAAEEQAPFAAPAGAVAAASDAQPAPMETPMRETPPPVAVVSLADARFDTGRPAVPESSLGGETTCIVCFTRPKNHLAVPCGHQCACGPCSAKMPQCPYCRAPVMVWMDSSRIRSV